MKLPEDELERLLGSFKFACECDIVVKAARLKGAADLNCFSHPIRGQWRVLQPGEAILLVKLAFAVPDQH
ncbi:hypothetical protein GCM10017643_39010 [Ancylobacter dichloromethanicus]|uniref:Uncharacterized protein n=1 Tax=Ancylobacter dichloromethanicus TaxID=518825 RepID=A0A9W6N130_9HYPH|nr:hypothetical protein GCM10017643_39010 [Ancylobacter dichloromethanicus]